MRTPHLEVLHLAAHSLASFPEHFLSYAPRLVELRLRVPLLQAFPSSFLGHVPRLETLELETTYDSPSPYAEKLPIRSLPANFLINAPACGISPWSPWGMSTSRKGSCPVPRNSGT